MYPVKAIGFDLFNTLITVESHALSEAMGRLIEDLLQNGLEVDPPSFKSSHKEAAIQFFEAAKRDGRETHNRFWITTALRVHGHEVDPEDPRIASAVEAYFSAFLDLVRPIPGTLEMLEALKKRYRVGLLSNFTHAPAARRILDGLGLTPLFHVTLISGELGYRKPHAEVFRELVEGLGVDREAILYVGDDPEPDITGALRAGIRPVWTTYVRDRNLPYAPGMEKRCMEDPEGGVLRISCWEDLLALLPPA
jgi:putative hydrolase of the HAD superfamily